MRHRASLRSPLKLEKHPLVRAHLWNRGTGALNNIHSEITCGVPVDWRLCNLNNVTLYIPQRSLTPRAVLSVAYSQKTAWQNLYHFTLCTTQSGGSNKACEVWVKPAVSRAWATEGRALYLDKPALIGKEGITLQEGPLQISVAQNLQYSLACSRVWHKILTVSHHHHEKKDSWLWMAKSR